MFLCLLPLPFCIQLPGPEASSRLQEAAKLGKGHEWPEPENV